MAAFLQGPDLWANIVGGVVTAGLLGLIAWAWDSRKHRITEALIEIMGRAIRHRNIGEKAQFADAAQWVNEAKAIEKSAVAQARRLSPAAGALVEWLDRVPPWKSTSEVERYISILSKVTERIREILERNS